jgi:hypothetical protein
VIEAAIKEKTIVVEKVAVASKTVIETTVKPSPHVTAKRPRGNRQSPKDCDRQQDTNLFHRYKWLADKFSARPPGILFEIK